MKIKVGKSSVKCCTKNNKRLPEASEHPSESPTDADMGFSHPDSIYTKPEVLNVKSGNLYQPDLLPHKGNKRMSRFHMLFSFISIVTVAAVLLFLFLKKGENKPAFTYVSDKALEIYTDHENKSTYIFNTQGEMLYNMSSELTPWYVPDKTSAILYGDNNKSLYCVNANDNIRINYRVNSMAISDDAKFICYATNNDYAGMSASYLYYYDIKKNKDHFVLKENHNIIFNIGMSPDGQMFTYSTVPATVPVSAFTDNTAGSTDVESETYLMRYGEKPVLIGKNIVVFAISDNARYIYYGDNKDSTKNLYVLKDDKPVLLTEDFPESPIYFNNDYSEVLYSSQDKTYISSNGEAGKLITDSLIDGIITPDKCISRNFAGGLIMYYPVNSFQNKIILCKGYTLNLIDEHYNVKQIYSSAEKCEVRISKDGNNLLYITSDGRLKKVSDLTGKCRQKQLMEGVDHFIASGDLSEIYYTCNNRLYYRSGNETQTLFTQDITDLCAGTDTTTVFFQQINHGEYELYYVQDGKITLLLKSDLTIEAQNWNYGVAFRKDTTDGYELYYNVSGMELKKILVIDKAE